MQVTRQTETGSVNAFTKLLEDRVGGITLAVADLAAGDVVKAGAVVGKDNNGLFQLIKSAKVHANATNVATSIQVKKGHLFKVGNHLGVVGDASKTITAIDTSNADYDTISLNATLGVALTAGDILTQVAAAAADNAALLVTPRGMIGMDVEVVPGDNHLVQLVVKGTAIEDNIPPIHSAVKALLPDITYSF